LDRIAANDRKKGGHGRQALATQKLYTRKREVSWKRSWAKSLWRGACIFWWGRGGERQERVNCLHRKREDSGELGWSQPSEVGKKKRYSTPGGETSSWGTRSKEGSMRPASLREREDARRMDQKQNDCSPRKARGGVAAMSHQSYAGDERKKTVRYCLDNKQGKACEGGDLNQGLFTKSQPWEWERVDQRRLLGVDARKRSTGA